MSIEGAVSVVPGTFLMPVRSVRAVPLDSQADVWIPESAQQWWLIIARDRRIQEYRAEIEAVRVSGARWSPWRARRQSIRSISLRR